MATKKPSIIFSNFKIRNSSESFVVSFTLLFGLLIFFNGISVAIYQFINVEPRSSRLLQVFLMIQDIISTSIIIYLLIYIVHLEKRQFSNDSGPYQGDQLALNIENENFYKKSRSVDRTGGVNLYLRLGIVVFGFASILRDMLLITDIVVDVIDKGSLSRINKILVAQNACHALFIFWQTYFLFRYHQISFQRNNDVVRVIISQLVVANICDWMKMVIEELNHELLSNHYSNKTHYGTGNYSNSTQESNHQLHLPVSVLLYQYLNPCCVEYSLICAAVFYKFLKKMSFPHEILSVRKLTDLRSYESYFSKFHGTFKGLFTGLIFLLLSIVSLAICHYLAKVDPINSGFVHHLSELISIFFLLLSLLIGFIKMKDFDFRELSEEEAFDANLLLAGWSGVCLHNIVLLIIIFHNPSKNITGIVYSTLAMTVAKSFLHIIYSSFQVLFIFESSRKCLKTKSQIKLKPGRSFVTFAIISNFTMWMVMVIQGSKHDLMIVEINDLSKRTWTVYSKIILPLIIFFRFHSVICLSDVWIKSFTVKGE